MSPIASHDAKDLIYEGIATFIDRLFHFHSLQLPDAKDLIYEGIATIDRLFHFHSLQLPGRQRPDLRRDCDSDNGNALITL